MRTPSYPRLLADIGGTNARFAWAASADQSIGDIASYRCADHASLQEAISRYLSDHGKPAPHACAIGIANPVVGDRVEMTNHHWSFSINGLKQELAVTELAVLNDFTALALSLPALGGPELHQIGGGERVSGAAMAVLGAGTGLGVSGLVLGPDGRYLPLSGEGGHSSLAPADDREDRIIAELRKRFGHVSAERALSGPGLVNLYAASSALAGDPVLALEPEAVLTRARAGTDAHCSAAIELFFSFLGGVAGNLALTLGARGGVFVGGGVVPRLLPEMRQSRFRERFEGKGRFSAYLASIPTFVIDAEVSPALIGASRALDD